jgi:hypothetical protein
MVRVRGRAQTGMSALHHLRKSWSADIPVCAVPLVFVAALLFFAVTPTTAQQRQPVVSVNGDHVLVALPDSVLKDRHVRGRLESALTTTFIVRTSHGAASRIEIRYDLWDEVYRVRRNSGPQQQIARTSIESWWQTPIDAGRVTPGEHAIEVELIVLPFSAAEENDARQWLSKSGGAGAPSANPSSIVDVLIGTTLSARPVVSFRWSVEVPRR